MEATELGLGSVFAFPSPNNTTPRRVLFVDNDVVMYDAWWSDLDSWGMADLAKLQRGVGAYYVTTVSTVLEKAAYVRTEALSAAEVALHRPDLPFAIGQNGAASWSSVPTTAAAEVLSAADDGVVIAVAQMYLSPFGPQGGYKRAVRVQADNGSSFTSGELLRKAGVVQAPHLKNNNPAAGVGLYREGLRRGLPSYYLWGAESHLHQHARE